MSTKKDVKKTKDPSVPKKKVATTSKLSTKKRDDSNERLHAAKAEGPVKSSSRITAKDKVKTSAIKPSQLVNKDVKYKSTAQTHVAKQPSRSSRVDLGTPPSSRVSKSQFYPSKNMYSNALNAKIKTLTPKGIQDEKKLHKKLKPEEEKKEQAKISPDSSSISERPRTATLRKGSIVNANIVGPDAPKLTKHRDIKPAIKDDYEDDFESYESDFEACSTSSGTSSDLNISCDSESSSATDTNDNLPRELQSAGKRASSASTDEERKLDSGNFEMPNYAHKQLLDNIKESIEKENIDFQDKQINPASLSDEGFEDAKSLQFINFLGAQEKNIRRRSAQLRRKRGNEIMSMIRLDTYDFTLFSMDSIPYDKFIQTYGSSNTIQTYVQTGEDDVSEQIQTDAIVTVNRWTQFPVIFSKHDENAPDFWYKYKSEFVGVGCDDQTDFGTQQTMIINESKLEKFLMSAGRLVLNIQEDHASKTSSNISVNAKEIPFSRGYLELNTKLTIYDECFVKCATFSTENPDVLLTVHCKLKEDDFKSIISLWNISQSHDPKLFLTSFSDVSCCTLEYGNTQIIIAGTNNGSILLWDVKNLTPDKEIYKCSSYTTDIDVGHHSKVVAIKLTTETLESVLNFDTNERQVCSLDEEGEIILWNIVTKSDLQKSIRLIKKLTISLKLMHPHLSELKCTDFVVDDKTIGNIYVSTNYGTIIKQQLNGAKMQSKSYRAETHLDAHCMEICPFSPDYFLTGYKSGCISLYSEQVDRPLMLLTNADGATHNGEIQMVQWSRNKPFIIYSKDLSNTIHIWDLSQSDVFPIYSIPFKEPISCMKLSPLSVNAKLQSEKSYMLLGTNDGSIHLHILNMEHSVQLIDNYNKEIQTFMNYVNRL